MNKYFNPFEFNPETINNTNQQNLIKSKIKNSYIIDLKANKDFLIENVNQSVNIEWKQIYEDEAGFLSTLSQILPDKSADIITYCYSGRCSEYTKNGLNKLGYKNVYNGINSRFIKNI